MKQRLDFHSILPRIQRSKFRRSFKLDRGDLVYINRNGLEKIRSHAVDFVEKRLSPANPPNDGKQTPFKGHPVFKAQHATATCCRGCLSKWHLIPKGRALTADECREITGILIDWIDWNKKLHEPEKIKHKR